MVCNNKSNEDWQKYTHRVLVLKVTVTDNGIVDFQKYSTRKLHNSFVDGNNTDIGKLIGIDTNVDFNTFVNTRKNKKGPRTSNLLGFPEPQNNESLEVAYKLQRSINTIIYQKFTKLTFKLKMRENGKVQTKATKDNAMKTNSITEFGLISWSFASSSDFV